MKQPCPLSSVCLFNLFSHEKREFIYLVCLGVKKSFNEDLFRLKCPPQNYVVHLYDFKFLFFVPQNQIQHRIALKSV